MKKILALGMAAMLLLAAAGCAPKEEPQTPPVEEPPVVEQTIDVISREEGSGTRGAFIELFGIEQKDAAGNKVDMTIDTAEINSSTSVVITTVAGDPNAIGYISLGSLNDTVKAVAIGGVAPSVAGVKDGSYTVARPFNIVTKGEATGLAKDFIDYIMSAEGQKVIEDNGYISEGNTGAYAGSKPAGSITVAGSSSVTPVMEKLKEAYMALNTGASIDIQMSDSTTGMTSAIDGICDIGMASREVKDSELEKGLTPTTIAMDGIAVIVNKGNEVSDLTKEDVLGIYTGTVTDWSELK
ncbi:MAG TPA: substrate-binding domain-containing protein [Candidatus Acidoferrum sp.]|nr:substrate-binding domain-containing protein [Candidatus Acidoferrum sp.]